MPTLSIPNVRIAGLAAAVPPLRDIPLEQLDLSAAFLASARRRNVRAVQRRARWEQCQSDFCVDASRRLLADLGWNPAEIDVVIMTTLTPDYPIPATAIIVQDRLGIPKTAVAFDLPSGSLGFLHGLQVLASMLGPGQLKRGLLLTGQVAKSASGGAPEAPLVAIDGHSGCVCALEYQAEAPSMHFDSGGDGAAFEALYMPVGGVRNPPNPEMFSSADGIEAASDYILDCRAVEAVALRELPGSVARVLQAANVAPSDLDGGYFEPLSMAGDVALRSTLQIPPDKFHSRVSYYGTSGSGTLPLSILARARSRLSAGRNVSLLGGVGPGLAWSSAVLTTENVVCPEILEV
jgi:3-oxoacyl-[acyl-carrier-protein] synthase III